MRLTPFPQFEAVSPKLNFDFAFGLQPILHFVAVLKSASLSEMVGG